MRDSVFQPRVQFMSTIPLKETWFPCGLATLLKTMVTIRILRTVGRPSGKFGFKTNNKFDPRKILEPRYFVNTYCQKTAMATLKEFDPYQTSS